MQPRVTLKGWYCGKKEKWALGWIRVMVVLHSLTSTALCQHWRKVWLHPLSLCYRGGNVLTYLYSFKPNHNCLGRCRMQHCCPSKIVSGGACLSLGIKMAKSPQKKTPHKTVNVCWICYTTFTDKKDKHNLTFQHVGC